MSNRLGEECLITGGQSSGDLSHNNLFVPNSRELLKGHVKEGASKRYPETLQDFWDHLHDHLLWAEQFGFWGHLQLLCQVLAILLSHFLFFGMLETMTDVH